MTLINIVETLQSEGHKITFRYRTDGSIIIKSIDGKKFRSLTEGNKTARSMVQGGELSVARATQVKYNVEKYIKLKSGEHKAKGDIEEALESELKKVQRLWRKNKITGQGHISKKKLRYYIKTEGNKKAMEYLLGRERYARGIANEANVMFLCQRLQRLTLGKGKKYAHQIDVLIDDIMSMRDSFREEWIEPCNQIAYDKTLSVEDKIAKIREIIGKPE